MLEFYVKIVWKTLELKKLWTKSGLKGSGGELEAKNCSNRQSSKFSFAFYAFINSPKQSCLGRNLLYISKKRHKINLKVFQYKRLVSVKANFSLKILWKWSQANEDTHIRIDRYTYIFHLTHKQIPKQSSFFKKNV